MRVIIEYMDDDENPTVLREILTHLSTLKDGSITIYDESCRTQYSRDVYTVFHLETRRVRSKG